MPCPKKSAGIGLIMFPRGSLQRPDTVRVFLPKLFGELAENIMIVRRLVAAHAFPIKRVGRGLAVWITIENLGVSAFRFSPVLTRESDACQPELQLRTKFIARQITFETVTFFAVRIEEEHTRCPKCVEAMEVSRVLFDVCCERYEVFVDEGGGFFVAV